MVNCVFYECLWRWLIRNFKFKMSIYERMCQVSVRREGSTVWGGALPDGFKENGEQGDSILCPEPPF